MTPADRRNCGLGETLTFGSLFTGIGGFVLGFERAGMTCKWQVEIDNYCNKVLAKHWPDVRRYKDVKECGSHNLEPVDVVCGGFPCQNISEAGKREGIRGASSSLWFEFSRIISEIQPRWAVVENVRWLLSNNNGQDFGEILWFFSQMGYYVEWGNLRAVQFGLPHHRNRVFIVANSNSERHHVDRKRLQRVFEEPQKIPEIWNWQKYKPLVLGNPNGVPARVDRLRALGNAVVPQAAEWIGRRIVEVELNETI